MLELWIIVGATVWLALMLLVLALCTASGRADREQMRPHPSRRGHAHRRSHGYRAA